MIIGHQKIISFLNKSIEKDKISHAYIFAGPAHTGKFSAALDFAAKLHRKFSKRRGLLKN